MLRQGQPIYRLDGPRLRGLLKKARILGGDRLSIDIMETEVALKLFDRVEGSATIIQVRVSSTPIENFVVSINCPVRCSPRGGRDRYTADAA